MIVLKALFILTFLSKAKASDDSDLPKFDFSSYEENSPFFSKELKNRLRDWNKTLINSSRYCANRSINGTGIETYIYFPVFDTKEIDDESYFLWFETFHPVLVRKKNRHDLATVAHLAIAELWPLLVLCFSCAALSGVIVWLLDSRSNSEHFPVCFWRGIFDGMWWAVVTMTTVGYGDKVPKSILARLFAAVWMIAGIILLSMFTAQVSSRLTAQELMSGNHLFGKKIGVPPGLYWTSYVDYKMAYSIVEEISDPMESATTLTGESLDSVVVFHCDDKEFSDSLQVLQFLPPCQVGAELSFYPNESFYDEWITTEPEDDFVHCMKRQTRLIHNSRKKNHSRKVEKSPSCKSFLEKTKELKFQFQWVYFESPEKYLIPFGIVVGAVVMATITGTVWDCFRQKKRNNYTTKRDTVYQRTAATEDEPGKTALPSDLKVPGLGMS